MFWVVDFYVGLVFWLRVH